MILFLLDQFHQQLEMLARIALLAHISMIYGFRLQNLIHVILVSLLLALTCSLKHINYRSRAPMRHPTIPIFFLIFKIVQCGWYNVAFFFFYLLLSFFRLYDSNSSTHCMQYDKLTKGFFTFSRHHHQTTRKFVTFSLAKSIRKIAFILATLTKHFYRVYLLKGI